MADITESVAVPTATGRVVTQRLHKDLGSGITGPQVVAVNPDGTSISRGGGAYVSVAVEVVRPADVTAYAALDTIDASTSAPTGFVFTGMARVAGGSGTIVKAQLLTNQKTNTSAYRLHLFNAAPTYINDNAPYTSLYTNAASRVGTIDFPAATTEDPTNSTSAGSQVVGTLLPFVCAATANLYGMLETIGGFTPASGQKFTVKLTAAQN